MIPAPEPLISPYARLCCGQPHYGAACPDGLVMCCLCFGRFPVNELNTASDGSREDACAGCAGREKARSAP